MLLGIDLLCLKHISDCQWRQILIIVCSSVIIALYVHLHEPGEANLGAYGTENRIGGGNVHR
ncbi:hypothetical protein D3C80_2123460 [compost metagenome]